MDGRDWTLFLQPYEQTVEELKVKFKTLRTELRTRDAYTPVEFVTGRVKRVSSILDKAKRLNVPMEKIETGIEDIAGIRIMCQFVDDIHQVAGLIRSRKDLTLVYEKDYITNFKESGYRSYHMIVEYPVQTGLGQKNVLAEIQIRTLAMNFWATIEHSLNYKYKESLPEDVRLRLKKAAEAASQLDEEMSNIRHEILDAQVDFEKKSNIVSSVLSNIQELYFFRRVREAVQFQLRFNELWELEDTYGIRKLADDLSKSLDRAKKGSDG
ncbi:GTP pyrophosphokinase [Paenibacillus spongiae]|uniref:GTP pyrophosphokinase family protein n=1 Tax=Paenibacillus spongiae TaxID=2909671 RepID=A0ABY5S5A6_9BACL|nr:GTP pyrophosphokinase family protein [Paenibacillus spongiae]UVI28047.1 GTP pyrophosphokinase family protein [Paenibacillus spongiae]